MTAHPDRTAEGVWDLTVATPIGRIKAVVEFRRRDGALTGVASGAGEDVPLRDIAVDGTLVTWKQSVTKPLRLNLAFAVDVRGDTLEGTSRAGRLPASKVTGTRRTTPARTAE
ncbi:hypothetical protein NC658_24295 [Streptomyces griseoincarnatus]|uniref:Uncharacterized protein n=1 Tax=Streptomyces griseoincarnatus TaxID=29305 RepID=A0ABT0VZH0_STRGI|nr:MULTISPECIES: hypothetical protein [Streptomyces]MBJ6612717.1 hypothetical protein [Streptomyces sp. I3(2020)]MBJ6629253.1 hypothetical protein [Streptomyces sp. I4(2020)]MCM2516335.1 hypothetical protein [Streptomyces griseoincarnatus]